MAINTRMTPRIVYEGNPRSGSYQPAKQDVVDLHDDILANGAAQSDVDALDSRVTTLETRDFTAPNPKSPVVAATTGNITLSGEQTIDGVSVTAGDRVLVKDQTTASENGIYVAASGSWSRAGDMDADAEVDWATVYVTGGTANGGTEWIAAASSITLGTDAMPWVQVGDNSGVQDQIDGTRSRIDDNLVIMAINSKILSGGQVSPLLIFAGGDLGGWYEARWSAALYQERGVENAATKAAVGDPVGTVLDISGNRNHWVIPSDDARPTLGQDSDGYYLDFDGVDDIAEVPSLLTALSEPYTVIIKAKLISGKGAVMAIVDPGGSNIWGSVGFYSEVGDQGVEVVVRSSASGPSSDNFRLWAPDFSDALPFAATVRNTRSKLRRGVSTPTFYSDVDVEPFAHGASDKLVIGGLLDSTPSFTKVRIYGIVIVDKDADTAEVTDILGYFQSASSPVVGRGAYSIRTCQPVRLANGDIAIPHAGTDGNHMISLAQDGVVTTTYEIEQRTHGECDHLNAGLIKRASDGKLLMVFAGHQEDYIEKTESVNVDNISEWYEKVSIDAQVGTRKYTYPEMYQLTGEADDPIYLFYRAESDRRYSKSTDGGDTWTTFTTVLSNDSRPYWSICQNGTDRLDFSVIQGNEASTVTNLYHIYMQNGTFYDTQGNALTLPIDPEADLTAIRSGTSERRATTGQITVDGSGNPCILYEVRDGSSNYKETRTARWDGTSWVDAKVCDMTDDRALGGVDPEDPDTVYVPVKDGNGVYQINKFTTSDSGATWTDQGALTSDPEDHRRVRVVPGAEPRIMCLKGTYGGSIHDFGDLQITFVDSTLV